MLLQVLSKVVPNGSFHLSCHNPILSRIRDALCLYPDFGSRMHVSKRPAIWIVVHNQLFHTQNQVSTL